MTFTQSTVRLSEDEKKQLELAAQKHGMSIADILRTGGLIIASFDKEFWKRVKLFSSNMRISESMVLQSPVTKWFAEDEALCQVNDDTERVFDEFIFIGGKPATFEWLYETFKQHKVMELQTSKDVIEKGSDGLYGGEDECIDVAERALRRAKGD